MFDEYKKRRGAWQTFEPRFLEMKAERGIETHLDRGPRAMPAVLLRSEPTGERCHRRLIVEYLRSTWGDMTAQHL